MTTTTFMYKGVLDKEPLPHRVVPGHSGHKPLSGYVSCEKLPKNSVYWFPVYVPSSAVPANLLVERK